MRLTSQNDCRIVWCIRNGVCAPRSSRQASHGTCARLDGVLLTIREGGSSSSGPALYLAKVVGTFLSFNPTFCCLVGLLEQQSNCSTTNRNNPSRTRTRPDQVRHRDQTAESHIETQKVPTTFARYKAGPDKRGPTLPYSQQHTIWTCTGSVRRLPWRSRWTHSNASTPHNSTIILTSQSHTLDLTLTPYAYVRV